MSTVKAHEDLQRRQQRKIEGWHVILFSQHVGNTWEIGNIPADPEVNPGLRARRPEYNEAVQLRRWYVNRVA